MEVKVGLIESVGKNNHDAGEKVRKKYKIISRKGGKIVRGNNRSHWPLGCAC